jgi:hypothetical protein
VAGERCRAALRQSWAGLTHGPLTHPCQQNREPVSGRMRPSRASGQQRLSLLRRRRRSTSAEGPYIGSRIGYDHSRNGKSLNEESRECRSVSALHTCPAACPRSDVRTIGTEISKCGADPPCARRHGRSSRARRRFAPTVTAAMAWLDTNIRSRIVVTRNALEDRMCSPMCGVRRPCRRYRSSSPTIVLRISLAFAYPMRTFSAISRLIQSAE